MSFFNSQEREDRFYGWFRCDFCNHGWESSQVYAKAGTRDVKYKQGCQRCKTEEAYFLPYAIEMIKCSVCHNSPCTCTCGICGGLKHKRYQNLHGESILDHNFTYCKCPKGLDASGSHHVDPMKPHMAELCERCKRGRPCQGSY